jgi:quercetin dioxygenase-like cupin family protein
MRLQFPDGYKIPPHTHPTVERLTILSGTFHFGMGEKFDPNAAKTYPPGSYVFIEPGMTHFAFAEGPTVVQLTSDGPFEINYVNPSDDPRQQKK